METLSEVMSALKQKGSAQTRKTFARHGAPDNFFGVKIGDLNVIAKQIRGNQELACALYETGNVDAMYLAGIVADGREMPKKLLNDWAKAAPWHMIAEYTVPGVAVESGHGRDLAVKWIKSRNVHVACAGWNTYAGVVTTTLDEELDLKEVEGLLKQVEDKIDTASDRVRYTMNGFVISVGRIREAPLSEGEGGCEEDREGGSRHGRNGMQSAARAGIHRKDGADGEGVQEAKVDQVLNASATIDALLRHIPTRLVEGCSMSHSRSVFVAVVLFIGLESRAVDAADPVHVRVLCYNIHYGQGTDGVYDIERLARVIADAKPDLVALQEVDVGVDRSGRVHEAQRLSELTGMEVRFGPTQHYQGGLFGNAVLSRFPIDDVEIHPLPYTEATSDLVTYPRGAIAVTVESPQGRPLRFVSTHFQHNVPEDRLEEAKRVNRLFATDDDLPTILAGDMNAVPDSAPIRELQLQWTIADDGAWAPTAPSRGPRSRIDYIFYRPGDAFELVQSEVLDEPLASDHRPVLATLAINPD